MPQLFGVKVIDSQAELFKEAAERAGCKTVPDYLRKLALADIEAGRLTSEWVPSADLLDSMAEFAASAVVDAAKVNLGYQGLAFHPDAFAMVQPPSRGEIEFVAEPGANYSSKPVDPKDRKSALMAAFPGLRPLSQLNNPDYESPEFDSSGIQEDEPEVDLMGELIQKWEARLAKWRSRGETGQTEMVEELGQRVAAKLSKVKPQLQAEFLASEVGEPA